MRLPPCTALVCLVRISLGFVFFFQWDEIIARVIAYDSVTSRFRPSSTGPQELLYIIGAARARRSLHSAPQRTGLPFFTESLGDILWKPFILFWNIVFAICVELASNWRNYYQAQSNECRFNVELVSRRSRVLAKTHTPPPYKKTLYKK